mmetsp:Transcript_81274/g.197026  ORF Transcript_81274/g.197026 Transcript_81274/m.197026 type:complete len:200 (-) Transcript_81274:3675-4274(-)
MTLASWFLVISFGLLVKSSRCMTILILLGTLSCWVRLRPQALRTSSPARRRRLRLSSAGPMATCGPWNFCQSLETCRALQFRFIPLQTRMGAPQRLLTVLGAILRMAAVAINASTFQTSSTTGKRTLCASEQSTKLDLVSGAPRPLRYLPRCRVLRQTCGSRLFRTVRSKCSSIPQSATAVVISPATWSSGIVWTHTTR